MNAHRRLEKYILCVPRLDHEQDYVQQAEEGSLPSAFPPFQEHFGDHRVPVELESCFAELVPFNTCHDLALAYTTTASRSRHSGHFVEQRERCVDTIDSSLVTVPENRIEWVALAEENVHAGVYS